MVDIKETAENIFLIDNKLYSMPKLGSVYLINEEKKALIDTGPTTSVKAVLEGIRQAGIRPEEINYIIGSSDDGANIAVVTHGGVIVSLLVYWLKIPTSRWRSIIQRQGAINIVVVDKGFPYISQINYTGHLNPVYDNNEDKVIEIYSSLKDDC